jgi:hypothetical protein
MDRAVFVYTTFPSLVEAEAAAKAVVEQKLAACANILTSAPFPKFAQPSRYIPLRTSEI